MRHYVYSALLAFPLMGYSVDCESEAVPHDQFIITTKADTKGAKLADGWQIPDKYNFGFGIDALIWHPKLDGTYFAYSVANSTAAIPLSGTMNDLPFKWGVGVRANSFLVTKYDSWTLEGEYTWFHEGTSRSLNAGLNNVVVPMKGYTGLASDTASVVSCTNARSQFSLTYQTLVGDAKKEFFVSRYLSFTPAIGLEAAWIEMTQLSKYSGGSGVAGDSSIVALEGNYVSTKDKTELTGVGPYAAMSSKWHIYKGLNFFGKGNFALDFTNYKVTHYEEFSADTSRTIDLSTAVHRLTPTASLAIGAGYESYCGSKNQFLVNVSIAYEATYWWQVYRPIVVSSVTNAVPTLPGNLALYGATIHAGISY